MRLFLSFCSATSFFVCDSTLAILLGRCVWSSSKLGSDRRCTVSWQWGGVYEITTMLFNVPIKAPLWTKVVVRQGPGVEPRAPVHLPCSFEVKSFISQVHFILCTVHSFWLYIPQGPQSSGWEYAAGRVEENQRSGPAREERAQRAESSHFLVTWCLLFWILWSLGVIGWVISQSKTP